jgi:hypothetical protein
VGERRIYYPYAVGTEGETAVAVDRLAIFTIFVCAEILAKETAGFGQRVDWRRRIGNDGHIWHAKI